MGVMSLERRSNGMYVCVWLLYKTIITQPFDNTHLCYCDKKILFLIKVKFSQSIPWRQMVEVGIAPSILDLSIGWRWVVKLTLRSLYSRERIPVPIEQEARWTPETIWLLEKRKTSAPARIRTPDRPAPILVAVSCFVWMLRGVLPESRQRFITA